MNEPALRVGVAGIGQGSTEFLPTLERMPEIQLVAAADLRPHALRAFEQRYGARGYPSVEALCEDPDVEAVWIATPNQFHGEHALLCAEHGKHMVIRKPMALTMPDCDRILEAAQKTGVKILAGGQTQGTNPLIRKIRQMLVSNELGPLRAINVWAYRDWMLSPRMPEEVDETLGGGIVWRQAPHHIETARWLGGGLARSVRAMTGRWWPVRPNATGYYAAFVEFEDGTPVTMVYNGYGYFDTAELVSWAEDGGMANRQARRRALLTGALDAPKAKEAARFGGLVEGEPELRIPWEVAGGEWSGRRDWRPGNQGVFIVTCQNGDIRMSPQGIFIYDDNGKREVSVAGAYGPGERMPFVDGEAMELYNAIRHGTPMLHDGRWGMATAEVQWAIIESARQRREILLHHQVPVPEGY